MPPGSWTLVGGLMVQMHALHAGMIPQRSTTDVDIVLHIETTMSWARTTQALHQCGYRLQVPNNPKGPSHRFVHDGDVIDVLIADHVAPKALEMRAAGTNLMRIPGATSALRKTVNCHIARADGSKVVISVPDVLGALTLKGGAYQEDSRDSGRHLEDAVVLLGTIEDADELVDDQAAWTQNDPRRIRVLARNLPSDHPAWGLLPQRQRLRAQQSLKILAEAH
ncbi:hypothetical protein GCM10011374_40500 [Kocuria dechangensis]|uniref:Uncharacterized protein n=2 Tax=Kocuria dechangensis TaxID=1176249 RepID=A0A917H8T6_9MICC|nr:hypothetical protein GCM10011374_40500 [Kocuria dechangensis]